MAGKGFNLANILAYMVEILYKWFGWSIQNIWEKRMYRNVPEKQGYTVEVKTKRKGEDGKTTAKRADSENRNGKTGKVARIYNKAGERVDKVFGSTFSHLKKLLREKYNIHPNIRIAKKEKTEF
jgi:hypothetical protein